MRNFRLLKIVFAGSFILGNIVPSFLFAQENMSPGPVMSEPGDRAVNETVTAYCNEKYEKDIKYGCELTTFSDSPNAPAECKASFLRECIAQRNELEHDIEVAGEAPAAYVPRGAGSLNILQTTSLTGALGKILTTIIGIVGSIALVMFIYGGFLWMTSQGNSDKVSQAVRIMVWSSLGVMVILSSYAIVDFLFGAFG